MGLLKLDSGVVVAEGALSFKIVDIINQYELCYAGRRTQKTHLR